MRPLLKGLTNNENVNLNLIISGGITKEERKQTILDIKNDRINVLSEIKIPEEYNNHAESVGFLCLKLPSLINKFAPDLCIVYADRYESFAFAVSSTHSNIPTLHIEAGDITEGGTYDDYIRHCITKMSHLFCTSTLKGVKVVKRLGEEDWRIINSGLLLITSISSSFFQLFVVNGKNLSKNSRQYFITFPPLKGL